MERFSRPEVERKSVKVLVYEYVTGGGLAGQDLPASWTVEGAAIRRAIAEDFASVPGVRVIMPLDERLANEPLPGVEVRVDDGRAGMPLDTLATEVDYCLVIAPETDGILADLIRRITKIGGRSLGSTARAIDFTADKARLAHHFVGANIPSPPTRLISLPARRWPGDWDGPIVVKPRFGAGSVDTTIVRDRRCPDWVSSDRPAIAQPYRPGRPMSASFLVDLAGGLTLLGVGRQRIEIDPAGSISYRGGTILPGVNRCPTEVEAAVHSVVAYLGTRSLLGFIGVDYLDDPEAGLTVLEINPRPTTSYVGLAKVLGPGTIAGAWLEALAGPLEATEWPGRLRGSRQGPAVAFEADGTLLSEGSPR